MADPTGIATAVVEPVVQSVLDKLRKVVRYYLNYKKNLETLSDVQGKLEKLLSDIDDEVKRSERNNEEAINTVSDWLRRSREQLNSERSREEESPMVEGDQKCYNYPKYRFTTSRRAVKVTEQMKGLIDEGNILRQAQLTRPRPIDSDPSGSAGMIETLLASRKQLLDDIMDVLKKNNNDKVNRIGIWGMGGVGKTTLVNDIAGRARSEGIFKQVLIVNFSQDPDVKQIQQDIAESIGLYKLKDISNEHRRAEHLNQSLKNLIKSKEGGEATSGKLLVILDNLWKHFGELHLLGIFHDLQNNLDFKIIVTSRSETVCKQMGATGPNIFNVSTLSPEEAMLLFKEKVGQVANNEEYRDLIEKVLKKYCSGLPLSIDILATRLKNQTFSYWRDIIQQLDKSVYEGEEDILASTYIILEMSYSRLPSENQQKIFLLCCLFRPGERILLWDLLNYGIGLGLFQSMSSLAEIVREARRWIENLVCSSLLLEFDHYRGEIKIHDDVREAGISIAKTERQFHVKACPSILCEQKHSVISLLSNDGYDYPSGRDFPRLQLSRIWRVSLSNLHDTVFNNMQNIKVLDLTGSAIVSFPPLAKTLWTLSTVLLDYCFLLRDISQVCKLIKLQVLSLRGSGVVKLPEQISDLVDLKLLCLTNCSALKEIPAGVLAKLINLKGLLMRHSFKGWQIKGNMACLSELKSLPLEVLEIDIQGFEGQLRSDFFDGSKLSMFEVQKKNLDIIKRSGWFSTEHATMGRFDDQVLFSSTLHIMGDKTSDLVRHGYGTLINNAETLLLDAIDGLTNIESICGGYHCHIERNDTSDLYGPCRPNALASDLFPNLRSIILAYLPELQPCALPIHCAKKLKLVTIECCQNLEYVFYGNENGEIQLPLLEKLETKSLHKLVGFCSETSQTYRRRKIKLSHLQTLELVDIPLIKHVWGDCGKVFLKDCVISNLKVLFVRQCSSMESLGPISMGCALGPLQHLEILECEEMKQVISKKIDSEEDSHDDEVLSFSSLSRLTLGNLYSLTCFYQGSIHCPVLKFLRLLNLRNIKSFTEPKDSSNLMEDDSGLKTLFSSKKLSLPSLVVLYLSGIDKIEALSDEAIISNSTELPNVGFESLISLSHHLQCHSPNIVTFSTLNHLLLNDLKCFKSINRGHLNVKFPCLKHLELKKLPWILIELLIKSEKCNNQRSGGIDGQEDGRSTIKVSLSSLYQVKFPSLKRLSLSNMSELTRLFDESDEDEENGVVAAARSSTSITKFPNPMKLELKWLHNFKWNHFGSPSMLRDLTSIEICGLFGKMFKCLFSTKLLLALQMLEELMVESCDLVENMFEVVWESNNEHAAATVTSLPRMRRLTLIYLPTLDDIPWHMLPNLQELYIRNCFNHNKKFLIPASFSNCLKRRGRGPLLQKLETLTIVGCTAMETIVGGDKKLPVEEESLVEQEVTDYCGSNLSAPSIQFPKLQSVELAGMKSLRTFSSAEKCDLYLTSLGSLKIAECINLSSFSLGKISFVPILPYVAFPEETIEMDGVKDLNAAVRSRFNNYRKEFIELTLKHSDHGVHEPTFKHDTPFCKKCGLYLYREPAFSCVACEFYVCSHCAINNQRDSAINDQRDEQFGKIWAKALHLHQHKLRLDVSDSTIDRFTGEIITSTCKICKQRILGVFLYTCDHCDFLLHPECAIAVSSIGEDTEHTLVSETNRFERFLRVRAASAEFLSADFRWPLSSQPLEPSGASSSSSGAGNATSTNASVQELVATLRDKIAVMDPEEKQTVQAQITAALEK